MKIINKVKKFYNDHKEIICTVILTATGVTIAYVAGKALFDTFEKPAIIKNDTPKFESLAEESSLEVEDSFEARKKDPKYQLANGGWITDDYEMCDWKCPDGTVISSTEMIINDLPIGNMGVFGEDICKKLDELYPDHGPITDVSMIIDLRSDPTFGKEEETNGEDL